MDRFDICEAYAVIAELLNRAVSAHDEHGWRVRDASLWEAVWLLCRAAFGNDAYDRIRAAYAVHTWETP